MTGDDDYLSFDFLLVHHLDCSLGLVVFFE